MAFNIKDFNSLTLMHLVCAFSVCWFVFMIQNPVVNSDQAQNSGWYGSARCIQIQQSDTYDLDLKLLGSEPNQTMGLG